MMRKFWRNVLEWLLPKLPRRPSTDELIKSPARKPTIDLALEHEPRGPSARGGVRLLPTRTNHTFFPKWDAPVECAVCDEAEVHANHPFRRGEEEA
jgi:hypothetical protein